jgi:hypothetical protein
LGHKYSLILSREITQEESEILRESGCYGATFVTDSLPTDLDVKVTKVDVDDTVSESLEKAIESGLEAAKKVPELSVPGLQVPALPVEKKADQPGVVAGEVIEVVDVVPSAENEEELVEASVSPAANGKAGPKPAANGKAGPKPAANGKTSTKSATNGRSGTKRTTNQKAPARTSSTDDAKELSEAVTRTD